VNKIYKYNKETSAINTVITTITQSIIRTMMLILSKLNYRGD